MNKKFVYQVGNNKRVILWCTAKQISRYTCSVFIIMNYNVWFVVRNGSVSLNLLIPQYGYVASLACFCCFWYMFLPVFFGPIVPLFPYVCWSVVVHTLYRVFLCTVLWSVLGMPILYGLLPHQTVGIVCICYLSLYLISLLHIIIIIIIIIVVVVVVVVRMSELVRLL